jgi:hypothetical protein
MPPCRAVGDDCAPDIDRLASNVTRVTQQPTEMLRFGTLLQIDALKWPSVLRN